MTKESADALNEAVAALRWIASNASVPADFADGGVRLRQIHARADEALVDVAHLSSPNIPPGDELWQAIAVGYCEWTNGDWPDDADLAEARAPAQHIAGYVRSWIARAAHNLSRTEGRDA